LIEPRIFGSLERKKRYMPEYSSQMLNAEYPVNVEFIPMEEEEGDFDTLVCVTKVYAEVRSELIQRGDIAIKSLPANERGVEILVLMSLIGTAAVASKDLLTSFFTMITAAIELLAKKDHVQEIEIIADGKTVILRDLDKKLAKEIVEAFEAQYPKASMISVSGSVVKVKARVSRKNRARN
jgi:hypothetical protein